MRIAYILPYLHKPGGWRSHAHAFINAVRQEIDPVLIVAADDKETARRLFPQDTIIPVPATQQAALNKISGIAKFATTYTAIQRGHFPQIDLVHSLEAYPTGLVGDWLARRLNCPHVFTANGTYGVIWVKSLLDRPVYARVLSNAATVIPASQGTAKLMQQYFGKYLARTQVVPIVHGNNYYKEIPHQAAWERSTPHIPTLLTVGQLKARKGIHISLAAYIRVKEKFPDARYRIVGDTSDERYYSSLQRFVSEEHLADVEFKGQVSHEEIQRMYREATVFVLTPMMDDLHFEGLGLVYLEAGAYGLPIVASRSGGVPDAVKDGETGFLAAEGDIDQIARAILHLLEDPELARQMGRANRTWSETLSWERSVGEHMRIYNTVIGTKNPR